LQLYGLKLFYQALEVRAKLLEIQIKDDAILELGRRSRGTPRIANRILRRIRDFALVKSQGIVTKEIAVYGLELLEIDSLGLDSMDRSIITTMIEKFSGGPVGIKNIAVSVGEESDTLEEVYEPYLIQEGLVQRTQRGRIVTELGYKHYGYDIPINRQVNLI